MKDRSRASSRRRFLGSALAAVVGLAAKPEPVRASGRDADRDRLERLAGEYGSELGELRRVGRLGKD